ncbi:hypothetical protein LTS07_006735 [Exophiala sideris]|uniref:Uncharacterized protein n=1 Tax=Exophiala sideris TaxID=1016849 RepID=A0ABR0J8Z9_9EURO|nr:hypothetical protein LTS07_006735 [Exophiala sideris]KAK5037550.1 hypothetical protein LTR13_004708 [Exophiala sideris]KAK5059211.1 hypothetical protein LTR69_006501 [Exophiala sideris]KAK5183046.1 hypothetical protein LTR44_004757 [Eurotiomycetes sp. CCFEE 6388]
MDRAEEPPHVGVLVTDCLNSTKANSPPRGSSEGGQKHQIPRKSCVVDDHEKYELQWRDAVQRNGQKSVDIEDVAGEYSGT